MMKLSSREVKSTKMREDLTEFVLDLLRQGAMKALFWLFRHPNTGIIVPCEGGAHAARKKSDVGCVLYTVPIYKPVLAKIAARIDREAQWRKVLTRHVKELADFSSMPTLNMAAAKPPAAWPLTTDAEGRAVPVYGLVNLLGEEKTNELLKDTQFKDTACLIMKDDERSLKAHMALLKLQNFLNSEMGMWIPNKGSLIKGFLAPEVEVSEGSMKKYEALRLKRSEKAKVDVGIALDETH